MLSLLEKLQSSVLSHLPTLTSEETLVDYRNEILGKNGELTTILK